MPRRRFGVALLVPAPFDTEIDGLRRACGDGALGRIPAHVTLVPPVNVRDDDVDEALSVLRAAAGETRPIGVRLGPVATFHPDTPVLYLAVSGGSDAVHALRDRVFVPPLARQLTWPFVPHVTVAEDLSPARLSAGVAALADFAVDVMFDRLHLLEERKDPERRRVWDPVADAPFGPRRVIGRGGLPLELTAGDGLDPVAEAFARREWSAFDEQQYGVSWGPEVPGAIVARREGAVVGIARWSSRGDTAHLGQLLVAEAERGTGVGGHLLAAVESLAAGRGCGSMTLLTEAGGRSEGFYRHRGWRIDVPLPRWAMGRDFVRLRRDLGA